MAELSTATHNRRDEAIVRACGSPAMFGNVTLLADGTVMPQACRELWVLRRSRGEWKIAQYMFQEVHAQ